VKRFETEGAWGGEAWTAVDVDYAARKKAAGFGSKIGVRTGALRASQAGGGGYSEIIEPTWASFGMSESSQARPYGPTFDATRKVIHMDAEQGREATRLLQQWVFAEARKAGIGNASLAGAVRMTGWTGRGTR
jgi:hypothetical protein